MLPNWQRLLPVVLIFCSLLLGAVTHVWMCVRVTVCVCVQTLVRGNRRLRPIKKKKRESVKRMTSLRCALYFFNFLLCSSNGCAETTADDAVLACFLLLPQDTDLLRGSHHYLVSASRNVSPPFFVSLHCGPFLSSSLRTTSPGKQRITRFGTHAHPSARVGCLWWGDTVKWAYSVFVPSKAIGVSSVRTEREPITSRCTVSTVPLSLSPF